ncbi:MAG: hypothetical protein KAS16_09240 [Thermoplasmata archaeon]|nr:hypothetical protein [Thermoplasmata archaeon]
MEGMRTRVVIEKELEITEYLIDGDWKREGDTFHIFGEEVMVDPGSKTGLKRILK